MDFLIAIAALCNFDNGKLSSDPRVSSRLECQQFYSVCAFNQPRSPLFALRACILKSPAEVSGKIVESTLPKGK